MKLLEKNKSMIAITTDMWTSNHQKRGFMAVTAHYIDDSWVLQNRIIRFIYVPAPHTAKVLCNELFATLMECNIDPKLSTVTLDNCSTNDAMVDLLKEKFTSKRMLLDGKFLHMRCCAHILNLIVTDGLEVIGDAIEKVRESVAYWRATPKREETFEKYARQLEVPSKKKLILDCNIRWNSTYIMLEIAITYQSVFGRLDELKKDKFNNYPSENDWGLAREVCERLKLFYSATELFSGTTYPTANQYFPKICQIRIQLERWKVCGNYIIESMAMRISGKFGMYWSSANNLVALASVLDPRYKMKLMEFYFPNIYGTDAGIQIEEVRKFCYEMYDAYMSKYNSSKQGGRSTLGDDISSSTSDLDLSNFDVFIDESNSTLLEKSELDKYLGEKCQPRANDFDVLAWWKINANDYPILSLVAKDVLAVPVSTVASESAFSTSGRFVSPHRSRLHPKTLEALMCAQDWLWTDIKGSCLVAQKEFCRYYDEMIDEDVDPENSCVTVA